MIIVAVFVCCVSLWIDTRMVSKCYIRERMGIYILVVVFIVV